MLKIPKFSIKIFELKFNKSLKYIRPKFPQHRHYSQSINNDQSSCKDHTINQMPSSSVSKISSKINFNEMMEIRRTEAKQSILVQVNSEKSFSELYSYCVEFGEIKGAHHYTQDDLHYILLEYENIEAAKMAISQSIHNKDFDGVAVHSPFLWFRSGPKPASIIDVPTLNVIDGNRMCLDDEFNEILQNAETLDDQIIIAHRLTSLNDIGVRLRFLAARQIEESIYGLFPNAKAYPFGSSVNGFGKQNCDLDMILHLNSSSCENQPYNDVHQAKRLVFHAKENLSNGRSQIQRHMENLSDMMQLFMPGVCQVRRILQARVPIIKYHHEHMNLEVDLSMSNLTGVYMSELLYMYGEIDDRVRPLIFFIRNWAKCVGLTNSSPGRWISNFSLTCLVIFFLQNLRKPILPTFNVLIQQARKNHIDDYRIISTREQNINCTFLRDLNLLNFKCENDTSMHELLLEFFEFYSQMNFNEQGLSINDGQLIMKPDHSAMYIMNPLEIELNVSKNVSYEECERFRIEVRNAAWILESNSQQNKKNHDESLTIWGLLMLLKNVKSTKTAVRPTMFFKPRMVDVSELFDGQQQEMNMDLQQIHFRNNIVKKQVKNIRKKGRDDIKTLSDNMMYKTETHARKR